MAFGLLKLGRSEPGRGPRNTQGIPPGLWCLHTLSTVPYVLLRGGSSSRVITWGECVELQESAEVINESYHAGEIVLAPVAAGVASARPATIIVPLSLAADPVNPGSELSSPVDTRQAVRGVLVRPTSAFSIGDAFEVIQFANRATAGAPGGGEAGPINYLTDALTIATAGIALWPGALQAPAIDVRPGAFWDFLRLRATGAVWGAAQNHVLLHYV
jgi:hypothetical protein